jgi:hypothetical protein
MLTKGYKCISGGNHLNKYLYNHKKSANIIHSILSPRNNSYYLCKMYCDITTGTVNIRSLIQNLHMQRGMKSSSNEISLPPIRLLNIGHNYFRHINPRRKKILMILLNSYVKIFKTAEERTEVERALDIFYSHQRSSQSRTSTMIDLEEIEYPDSLLWHLNVIIQMERISSQYSRFEFLEYDKIIKILNSVPREKRHRAKFVFTSHPTQANSIETLKCISEILKGIEENDLDYLDYWMEKLHQSNINRVFVKPSYIEESINYHSISIPNLINAFSMLYESGLKNPGDFFEAPGTWITFDFDNHPEMSVGLMTYTHGLVTNLTIREYLKIIREANLQDELQEIVRGLTKIQNYAESLMSFSDQYKAGKISKNDFFSSIPVLNIHGVESRIKSLLEEKVQENFKKEENSKNYSYNLNGRNKLHETCTKLLVLFDTFRLTTVSGQIRLAGEDLLTPTNIKPIIPDILKEISILNSNSKAADMIIIANYEFNSQYELIQNLLKFHNVKGMEIVPLLETFSASNDTSSSITMIASSDTRQRDGLILTELRTLREFNKNPDKYIYMGQGVTAERGGGPYNLVHQKLKALTKVQRERHIRTVQGHGFMSEFASRDLVFAFLLNCAENLNMESFSPSQDYMDFLFDLDNIVGVPQRELQKTKKFNDFYVKNNIIKTLVETFNYAGSRELGKPLENVKKQRAIVQAYINSDRCSFTHPELAYWDRLDASLIRKFSKYYYENNPHFKYLLLNYSFMIKKFDLEFAKESVNRIDNKESGEVFEIYYKGYRALCNILNHLGLGKESDPVIEMWNQHLGLLANSSEEESRMKSDTFKFLYVLQNHYGKKYLKEKNIGVDSKGSERKLKILQSTLANISSSNGKG